MLTSLLSSLFDDCVKYSYPGHRLDRSRREISPRVTLETF